MKIGKCKSGAVVEYQNVALKDVGSSPDAAAFDFDTFVGKLTENCRKTPSRGNEKP
jgi:hypothetical protein